jgi:hypothetical protein
MYGMRQNKEKERQGNSWKLLHMSTFQGMSQETDLERQLEVN